MRLTWTQHVKHYATIILECKLITFRKAKHTLDLKIYFCFNF